MSLIHTLTEEDRRKADAASEQRYRDYVRVVEKDIERFLSSVRDTRRNGIWSTRKAQSDRGERG